VFLNFFIDHETDTRTPLRFSIVGEKAAGLDLESRPVEDFVKLLLEKKTVVDPTLVVFEDLFVARAGEIAPSARGFAHRLPTSARRDSLVGGLPVPDGMDGRYRDSAHATLVMVKKLHRAGVPIVAGTDFRAGPPLVHELELYVQAGMTPAEALATATSVPARVNKRQSGVIAPGRDADLIVVDGDPLKNIADLYRVKLTIRGGTVIQAPELGEAMGIKRYDAR